MQAQRRHWLVRVGVGVRGRVPPSAPPGKAREKARSFLRGPPPICSGTNLIFPLLQVLAPCLRLPGE